jgi:hypothetical protein
LAILIKEENYDTISYLLNTQYFITKQNALFGSDTLLSFCALRNHCDFVHQIKKYSSMLSANSAFLKERNQSTNINFYYIMEVDFICFLKAVLINDQWYPDTLIYLNTPHRPFEIFAKSASIEYFSNLTKIFGFKNVTDIAMLLAEFRNKKNLLPYWEGRSFEPYTLIDFERLALSNELLK